LKRLVIFHRLNMYKNQFITLRSFPQAIVHIDADAFFASVEQAIHPEFRGKPLVTGAERGIIAAASYEAKALGIRRGIHLRDAKKICPELIVQPTDYETCSLFSKKMFDVMRRYTTLVEEYSVDEAFLDLTGLRRVYRMKYEKIAAKIKHDIDTELGITVSVGLSLSKGLAKLCSSFRKPNGFTAVKGRYIHLLLERTKLIDVWGIGHNTANLLKKYRINNALQFVQADIKLIKKLIGKLGVEMHQELRGKSIYSVSPEEKNAYKSVSKFKTFSPATTDRSVVKAFLLRNLESACIKARRHSLTAGEIHIVLRTQDFKHYSLGAKLNRQSSNILELTKIVSKMFEETFKEAEYRATGIVLARLNSDSSSQLSIFDDPVRIVNLEHTVKALDAISKKYGKHTLHVASTISANHQHKTDRGRVTDRKKQLFKGETKRQRLNLPMMFVNV